MSELGAALVELGQVPEGVALLDEAMAGALSGEGGGLEMVVVITCRTITSCSRCGDLARAVQWVRAADDFYQRYGSSHLYTTCRTRYGSILLSTGKWDQAEHWHLCTFSDFATTGGALLWITGRRDFHGALSRSP
jgi:hypothetical protein